MNVRVCDLGALVLALAAGTTTAQVPTSAVAVAIARWRCDVRVQAVVLAYESGCVRPDDPVGP